MWIKICGVTRTEDVAAVVRSGADAIGFNFFSESKRFVSIATARDLAQAARRSAIDLPLVDLVGVFVNTSSDAIKKTVQEVGLSAIQIHGDETPEQIAEIHQICHDIPIIRAFRVDSRDSERTLNAIDRLVAVVPVAAILLDAFVPGEFGGTGTTIDPAVLESGIQQQSLRLILAGGLTPQNVASLINRTAIWGIDTASGVESAPGIKDSARIHDFINRARDATHDSRREIRNVRLGRPSRTP